MASGISVVTTGFMRAAAALSVKVKVNSVVFAGYLANKYRTRARANALWHDRSGTARSGLDAVVETGESRVTVRMGGYAQNRSKKSRYKDYMELLEFGHNSSCRYFPNLAIIYPTFDVIKAEAIEQFGEAALGNGVAGSVSMVRSREAARQRAKNYRARHRQ